MLKGAAELDRKLAELGAVAGERVMNGAMRAALRVVKTEAEAAAKGLNESGRAHRTYKGRLVAPGFASRSLRVVMVRQKATNRFRAVLGVRREAFYAVQFLEVGVESRGIPRGLWLTGAYTRTQEGAQKKLVDNLRARIERAAKGRKV